jgi:phenylpropionate dioxygenase-like ring-hydroxylating dioxygenase large terminal subunit
MELQQDIHGISRQKSPGSLDLSRPWLSHSLVAWPVLASVELKREQAIGIRAFGLPLLLIRGRDGAVSAHIDRCPHRQVSFFCGPEPPLVEGSHVRCPFHFQRFDQQGHCVQTLHGESGSAEKLLTLPLLEEQGFLWLPVSRDLFDPSGHLNVCLEEVNAARSSIHLPAEFRHLNDPEQYHCRPLYTYRYAKGPWGLTITSGIDHTHGFQVHGIAKVVHGLRRWLGQETLSGIHMVCDNEERSVLVTYTQLSESLRAYWKVGGAPNLWLNKLDEGLFIAVLFVPEDSGSTMTRGSLYLDPGKWGALELSPLLRSLHDLSIQNSQEDRPFIESQADYLHPGEIPIGNASLNDAPVYHFMRYLREMTGTPIDFGFIKTSVQELVCRNFWSS